MQHRSRLALAAIVTSLCCVIALTSAVTSAAGAVDRAPVGHLDTMRNVRQGVEIVGWDADYDSPATALTTYATIDHHGFWTTLSNVSRPDVAAAFPTLGARHGFDYVLPVPAGQHTVCVSAINLGKYEGHLLGCQSRLFGHNPYGYLDSVTTSPGAVRAVGWGFDPEAYTAPLTMTVTLDGVAHQVTANLFRPDVAAAHPIGGPLHGFGVTLPAAQGLHTVCVTAGNIGVGYDTFYGCRTVLLNDDPFGYLDTVQRYQSQLLVAGWAGDRDNPSAPVTVDVTVDGAAHTLTANQSRPDVARAHPDLGAAHGYSALYTVAEGTHQVCVTFVNIGFGANRTLTCKSTVLGLTPTAFLNPLVATKTGASLSGWATDPDATTAALSVRLSVDGVLATTTIANRTATTHTGHAFSAALRIPSGTHTVCAVAANAGYGTHDSPASCQTITLALGPIGFFDSAVRVAGSTDIAVTGWGIDPDTTSALNIAVTVDGVARPNLLANVSRPDVEAAYPGWGPLHGYAGRVTATDGEHTVCVTARNVGLGTDHPEGCRIVNAVHPVVPGAPRTVTATPGYGAAVVRWIAPATDGGAPWTRYVVTASPGGRTVTAAATATSATVTGLASHTSYKFLVQAVNVAGTSPAGISATVTTMTGPPPQTTPAPVSTSRYVRNVTAALSTDLARMRAEGVADATANPTGHSYLILLDIGGQDQYDQGVVLSATTHFVSYANLVSDVNAYVDGYHSAQRAGAPVIVAIGTNNDMDVSYASGQAWADNVVDKIAAHAVPYLGLSIAGANDIEPGFRATYTATRSWLSGYLASTTHRFIFNGSADGCSWTSTGHACNNGWTMSGLYTLAAGASPIRVLNLPQIYNTTMAAQWKYISLTGIAAGLPRINFGGPLTEWTACVQTSSCGSLPGHTAWSSLWNNLQSDSRLKVGSLPFSTDLRIN